ncbi:hypothetical protein R3P38DRAFT_1318340 [Favolaschia claudopus]|uniref:Uncharacterized protein n=1 Tax=Favolaschia claudopus TaxID=2862362 RepID=A0AAW0AVB2_9AGAR
MHSFSKRAKQCLTWVPNNSDSPPAYDQERRFSRAEDATSMQPRYLYYRVYRPDTAVRSKAPFDRLDPCLGRIKARSVPPPHTAAILKGCLVAAEGLSDAQNNQGRLYLDLGDLNEPQEDAHLAWIADPTVQPQHGHTPQAPLALVYHGEDLRGRWTVRAPSKGREDYLYYSLFNQTGEISSATSFDRTHPSLGRIQRSHIPPSTSPVFSVKRAIAKVEKKGLLRSSALYVENMASAEVSEFQDLPYMQSDRIGTRERPIVLVIQEQGASKDSVMRPARLSDGDPINGLDGKPIRLGDMFYTDGKELKLKCSDVTCTAYHHYYECIFRGPDSENTDSESMDTGTTKRLINSERVIYLN